jgi:hypothetical protein
MFICLNIGVDPPDIVKTNPCAKLECWLDPTALPSTKAIEAIGRSEWFRIGYNDVSLDTPYTFHRTHAHTSLPARSSSRSLSAVVLVKVPGSESRPCLRWADLHQQFETLNPKVKFKAVSCSLFSTLLLSPTLAQVNSVP